ncbi:MAG: MFS transporter, partial [Acidimicrobiales bacterium]
RRAAEQAQEDGWRRRKLWRRPGGRAGRRGRRRQGSRQDRGMTAEQAGPPHGWQRLLVEPRRPEAVRNSSMAPWLVVGTVCIGAFIGQLDASIVTLAFPTFRHAFGASLASVQWVGQAYLLVLIGLVTAVGRYADMIGRKLLYTYGFLIFIIGSALCGIAPDLPALIGFRVLQGFGAAMLQANSVAIIVGAMPRERLGRAIGVQGAAQALGLALGPAVGGLLISLGGWRLIFLVNIPFGLAGTVLAWFLIPRSRDLAGRTSYDWRGLSLFLPAACALLLAISYGNHWGWGSPLIAGLFAVTVVLVALFLRRERRTPAPMLDLGLFSRVPFGAGIASGLLSYLVLFGTLTVVPFFLEVGRHQSSATAGAELLLLPLGVGVTAPLAGRLSDRVGARPLTVGGMIVAGAGLAWSGAAHARPGLFLLALAVTGVGLGAFTPPNNAAIMGSAPSHQTGMAGGVLNMTRGLGTSLGLAFASLAYTLGAGARSATAHEATTGFVYAVVFLVGTSVIAAVIAGLRGPAQLSRDPVLVAE